MAVTMKVHELLPKSSTPLERDLADVIAPILGEYSYAALNDPQLCPVNMLGWLAWSRHVDTWGDNWAEDRKRKVITEAPLVHRRKGTLGSMRRAMRAAGFGEFSITRKGRRFQHNGKLKHNGQSKYAQQTEMSWAQYEVAFHSLLTSDQLKIATQILNVTAPARNELIRANYEAPAKHNRMIKHNGKFRYGVR